MAHIEINTILAILIFLLSISCPLISAYIYFTDTSKRKKANKEIDEIVENLNILKSQFSKENISEFSAKFSNYFENSINSFETNWIKMAARMLMHAKPIGLGEDHREEVINNKDLFYLLENVCTELIENLDNGDVLGTYTEITNLYSIFYFNKTICNNLLYKENNRSDKIAIDAIEKTIKNLDNLIEGNGSLISEALKTISDECKHMDIGFSIYILQWSILIIKNQDVFKKNFLLPFTNQKRRRILEKLISKYKKSDYWGAINLINNEI